jgi:hypothetical protein
MIETAETEVEVRRVDVDKVSEILSRLQDAISAKRANINSWDNYGTYTFLSFDSYNLGLTTARDMLGSAICEIQNLEDGE